MLDRKFFRGISTELVERYRKHIFEDAKDVYGKKFKGYSNYGSKWVTMNVKKEHKKNAPKTGYSYSQAKKGKLFKRQYDRFANTTAPVLSGDLLRDFGDTTPKTFDKPTSGMRFGWSIYGSRVEHLRKKGRVLTAKSQPIPNKVDKYLRDEAAKYIFEGLKKEFGDTKIIKLNIGKKKK